MSVVLADVHRFCCPRDFGQGSLESLSEKASTSVQKTTGDVVTSSSLSSDYLKHGKSAREKRTKKAPFAQLPIDDMELKRETLSDAEISAYDKFDVKRGQIVEDIRFLLQENMSLLGDQFDMKKMECHFANFLPQIIRKTGRKKRKSIATTSAPKKEFLCQAYVQCAKRCSRKVDGQQQRYCGLHTILRFGDIHTGYLKKNNILRCKAHQEHQ